MNNWHHPEYMYYNTYKYLDWNGEPIKRTPDEYRYSYDAYVIHQKTKEYQHAVYSDRLMQWNYNKHESLLQKHFGDKGQNWTNRNTDKVQDFLRDYYDNNKLELVGIMTGCNVGNGFPYWIFMFNAVFE